MEHSEWPDAERLKELRQEGKFPYSKLSVQCIAAVIFLAVTYFQFPNFQKLLELFRQIMQEPVTNFVAVKLQSRNLLELCSSIFSVYALAAIICYLCITLIQSKFYFSLTNFSFNLANILKVKNVSMMFFVKTIGKGFFGMLLGALMGTALFYWVSRQFLGIMLSDAFFGEKGFNAEALLPVIKSLLVAGILALIALSAFSYLAVRLSFLNKHRNKR
jgi:flagellar biosynthesis protein FlhB